MENSIIFSIFDQITKIPRESGKEEKIIAFLKKFASERELECKEDEAGNIVIIKDATAGMESAPTVVLQSHSDMVCEKNSDSSFNFDTDPITYVEEDGWIIAKETTLGADCGIGMAAQLAVLDSSSIKHGKIEALFTTEEETGLVGAKSLKPGFITGNILINLDSEDEGELFIGCAGGIDTTGRFKYTRERLPENLLQFRAGIYGATGGHSGDDIHKNRANANQILLRYLYLLYSEGIDFRLCAIDGGNKRNAIAREATAHIAIDPEQKERAEKLFTTTVMESSDEHRVSDPELHGKFETAEGYATFIDEDTKTRVILSLNSIPHGVLAMSQDIEGFVETSTNLASIKTEDQTIRVGTSQRSSINSARYNAARRVESALILAGAEVTHESEYPGWKPKTDSPLLTVCRESYKRLFGTEPIVRAIHAGLECGLFLDIYPNLDMISFGPTIKGAHAPGERLEIASVDKFRLLLIDVLERIK